MTVAWLPVLADVGALVRARTRNDDGIELGTFDASTRPTGDAVSILMMHAASEVEAVAGDVPVRAQGYGAFVIALGTAMLVEASYFPETLEASPLYDRLKEAYDNALARLVLAAQTPDDEELGGVDAPGLPHFSFPEDAGGMIGWGTRW